MPWQKTLAERDLALFYAVTEKLDQLNELRFESAFLCRRLKRDYWETLTEPEHVHVQYVLYLCGEK